MATARYSIRRAGGAAVGVPSWPALLGGLAAVSAALTVWGSWAGSRSDYYAAIALSMSRSWQNFFFGAFDPAGTLTLDKIPGSFWVPALFVKVFGFSTFSVVVPNALAAVAAVVLVAITAKRLAGRFAGVVAGGITATTPIFVAVARSNQPESFFVLALALTAWAAARALQHASLRWLLLAGVFIAAGFQCYMLESWAVWPALGAAYLCTRIPWRRRVSHIVLAGATSTALSLVWIMIVSMIPPANRPYIGSTLHNSPWEMVFGYNGLGRFGAASSDAAAYRSFTPPFSGSPGVLRLLAPQLAGQIGWLLPTALLAVVILLVLRTRVTMTVFLGGWLITGLVMYSAVAGMHQFYTAALAVPVALVIAVAFAAARRRGMLWPQLSLLIVAVTTALGIAIGYDGFSVPVAAVQAAVATGCIVALVRRRGVRHPTPVAALVATVVALALAPTSWSIVTMAHPDSVNPVAGDVDDVPLTSARRPLAPASGVQQPLTAPRHGLDPPAPATDDAAVLRIVDEGTSRGKYRVAVFGAQPAASLIIASDGGSVLPIGGFAGTDPVPTLEAFTAMVQAGDIPYVLMSGTTRGGFFPAGSTNASRIRDWVADRCTELTGDQVAVAGLYRCGSR